MSWQNNAVRYVSVGEPSARFRDLTLRFDHDGEPVETVVWLKNGGGKSSMESLRSAVILPRKSDFTGAGREDGGHRRPRELDDYVRTGDTSHTVLLWTAQNNASLYGERLSLLTGAVYEWPDRRRPATATEDKRIAKWWWSAVPAPGVLDLDTLPVRDGKLLTAAQFKDRLRRVGADHPELQVHIATTIGDWEDQLARLHVDTALYKYQARMNTSEGGIAKVFTFNTVRDFVDLVMDVVSHPRQAAECGSVLAEHAKNLFRAPALRTEFAFLKEAADVLRRTTAAEQDVQACAGRLAAARDQNAALRAALGAASAQRAGDAARRTDSAAALSARATELNTQRRQLERHRLELLRLAANDRLQSATARAAGLEAAADAARADAAVWQVASPLVEQRAALAKADELAEQLKPERAERAALSRRHDAAAMSVRVLLVASAAAAEDLAAARRLSAAQERSLAEQKRASAVSARNRAQNAVRGAAEAAAAAAKHAADVQAARDDGTLQAGEEPAGAEARLVAEAEAGAAAAQAEEVTAAGHARLAKQAGESARDGAREQALAEQAATSAAQDELALTAAHSSLAHDQRLLALAEADGAVDVWGDSPRLVATLRSAAREADRRALEEAVGSAEDERRLESIGADGYLPAPTPLLAAVAVLSAGGLAAQPAWAYLRQAPAAARAAVAERRPDLASAIAVQDEHARRRALELLVSSPTLSLIPVVTAAQVDEATGPGAVSVLPHPTVPLHRGLYDQSAADEAGRALREASDARAARRSQLRERAQADRGLAARLDDFLAANPSPGALDAAAERSADTANAAQAAHDYVLAQIVLADEHAAAERQARDARAAHLSAARAATRSAAAARVLASRQPEAEEAARTAAELEKRAGSETAAAGAADASALAHERAAAEHDRSADAADAAGRASRAEIDATTWVGDPPHSPDPALTAAGLAQCRARHAALRGEWLTASSGSVLEATLAQTRDQAAAAARRARGYLAEVAGDRASVLARAEAAAADPAATAEEYDARRAAAQRFVEEAVASATAAALAAEGCRQAAEAAVPPPGRSRHTEQPVDYGGPDEADAAAALLAVDAQAVSEREAGASADSSREKAAAEQLAAQSGTLRDLVLALAPEHGESTDRSAEPFAGTLDEARRAVEQAAAELRAAEAEHAVAADARAATATEAMRCANRLDYAGLDLRIRDRLRDGDPVVLGARSADYEREVARRLTTLDEMLAQVAADEHRVTSVVAGHVRQILNGIAGAARASRLPVGLGDLSEKQFITIRFSEPTADELAGRVEQELVALLAQARGDTRSLPSPDAVLHRAVHAAVGAKGFSATILKPNEHMIVHPVDVTQVSVFSDGEKLTTCVLLFCAFARMRQRGSTLGGATGTLVLDNPFGRASSAELVQLQLAVAAIQRVHLVYYTGLEDMGALLQFRRLLRLRNRSPRGSTDGHVRMADDGSDDNVVTGIAVGRPDAPVPPAMAGARAQEGSGKPAASA